MRIILKLAVFFAVLSAGVFYVDYQNNSLFGEPGIRVVQDFAQDFSHAAHKIREKLPF